MQPDAPKRRKSNAGFTRLELLTLLASLVVLAVMTRPVWGNPGATASLVCMDNLRRLSGAWLLYAEDDQGEFVGNYHGGFIPITGKDRPWATGWLDWSTSSDNTNKVYLTNSRYAALAPYLGGNSTVYKCPADVYVSTAQAGRGWPERVRTYSMNCAIGEGNFATGPVNPLVRQVTRNSDFGNRPPQQVFVFLDEHPDSINDPLFWVPNSATNLPDIPGALHDGAGWLTFADGHLELHAWQSPELTRPVTFSYINSAVPAGNSDAEWLLDHTPQK